MGCCIDVSTAKTYGSALNSYLNFVKIHKFSVEPTIDTLSFYIVFMCDHIRPKSVASYLSGICNQLEPYFENIRKVRKSSMVERTLRGCLKSKGATVRRKAALATDDVRRILEGTTDNKSHNTLLFRAMLVTGFCGLMRLGELALQNDASLDNYRKVTRRSSAQISGTDSYSFTLRAHKADAFFEGNKIIISSKQFQFDPVPTFVEYMQCRDDKHPMLSPLWLDEKGEVPRQKFFINRLEKFCGPDIAGQSLRAGGATTLAMMGTPPHLIQAIGRWSSDAYKIYIRRHPALIQACLYGNHN